MEEKKTYEANVAEKAAAYQAQIAKTNATRKMAEDASSAYQSEVVVLMKLLTELLEASAPGSTAENTILTSPNLPPEVTSQN